MILEMNNLSRLGFEDDEILERARNRHAEVLRVKQDVAKQTAKIHNAMSEIPGVNTQGCTINARHLDAVLRNVVPPSGTPPSWDPPIALRETFYDAQALLIEQSNKAKDFVDKIEHLRELSLNPITTVKVEVHISSFIQTELKAPEQHKCLETALSGLKKWRTPTPYLNLYPEGQRRQVP